MLSLQTLQPTHESDAARKQVVSDMQQLVTTALPQELHCGVETFGSYRAGLHLPGELGGVVATTRCTAASSAHACWPVRMLPSRASALLLVSLPAVNIVCWHTTARPICHMQTLQKVKLYPLLG